MKNGRLLMMTLTSEGASFSLSHGVRVPAKLGRELTRNDSSQRDIFTIPNEDGLFEGFSQTWRTI